MHKFRIYTFGSNRHSRKLKQTIVNSCCEIIHINEEGKDIDKSKSEVELLNEFKSFYMKEIETKGFIVFGRATVQNGIENIVKAIGLIKEEYSELRNVQVVGPSIEAAKIFNNKALTQKVLADNNIPTPKTYLLNSVNVDDVNFPVVLKALNLSGGRGMKFVRNKDALQKKINDLKEKGINNLIVAEFVKGIEITYTVLRLGDTFLRLPVSYKKETNEQLIHPDSKVKLSGFYDGYEQHYRYVEDLMKKYNIHGLFTLQGVLKKTNAGQYEAFFLEAATRITGSTPIMVAALKGFNLYKTMADWIINRDIQYSYERACAIQYSSYQHKGKYSIEKLLKQNWIVEAKYENLAEMLYTEDKRDRVRISFKVSLGNLSKRLKIINDILGNHLYGEDIFHVLGYFKEKNLKVDNFKRLEGTWNENVSWEFYLSDYLPERKLCSAVFAIMKHGDGIVLTKTHRGWELPGGHIEDKETIEEALKREVLEETGAEISRFKLIGYRKIIAKKPNYDSKRKAKYPFPISYIPHYLTVTDKELIAPTGDLGEVLEAKKFSLEKLQELDITIKPIVNLCLEGLDKLN